MNPTQSVQSTCARAHNDTMERDDLEKWLNHTLPGEDQQLIATGKGSFLNTRLNPPLEFDTKNHAGYEMALLRLETYYSFPNIDASNNCFRVSITKGRKWIPIVIPMGCYDISSINSYLQRQLAKYEKQQQQEGDEAKKEEKNISFEANPNTLKCVLDVKNANAMVDFKVENSLRSVLGFTDDIYKGPKRYESESIVNILSVNTILVHCDIIGSSRVNGVPAPIIYGFFPDVSPGDKIVSEPKHLIYMPLTMDVIPSMSCWLTDQNHKRINLRGEELTLTFHVRKKR